MKTNFTIVLVINAIFIWCILKHMLPWRDKSSSYWKSS